MAPRKKKEPVTTESTEILERIDAQIRLDFRQTFSPDFGQNVLYYLANKYNLFASHDIADHLALAFQEGQRSVVLEIIEKSATLPGDDGKKKLLKEVLYG